MNTTLTDETLNEITRRLGLANTDFANRYPGETGDRQALHTVYGGAHLFKANTAEQLGNAAIRSMNAFAQDPQEFAAAVGLPPALAKTVYERVQEKLEREPIEDFRIDFEDGYGVRTDGEEDGHAVSAAKEVARGLEAGSLPPFIGIRIKPLNDEFQKRSLRTLDLFISTLLEATKGELPANFVVTLPKIVSPTHVSVLADVFDHLESGLGLNASDLKMEMMIETTQSLFDESGGLSIPKLLDASRGRCVGAHFGVYDYTANCSITAAYQEMTHPACDFARGLMQIGFAGTGVRLSDGATNIMPIPPHRGDSLTPQEIDENRQVVHRAWNLHYEHIRHSLKNGFYQGWDLHPAQFPTRYAAVYTFFLEGLNAASERLTNFIEKAAQATLVGDVFDDAATGQGLLNYFLRALNCGAVLEDEVQDLTGLSLDELHLGSFMKILEGRKADSA